MSGRIVFLAAFGLSVGAFAQSSDTPFQIRYASNLNIGDSIINITNSGPSGTICANIYVFSPDEQLVSCCSCPVTTSELARLSSVNDAISNTLTPSVPTSIVIKLLASAPIAGTCSNSATAPGPLTTGLIAWGTTLHALPSTPGSPAITYGVTETSFTRGVPSAAELTRLTTLCSFINSNGSGFGICRSCRLGGAGAVRN